MSNSTHSNDNSLTLVRLERERRKRRAQQQALGPLVFRGAGLRVQTITDREWMLAGPSETGKTWATLWRLDTLLRATPRAQAALVRKTRVTIGPTVLVTYLRIQERRAAMGEAPAIAYGGNNPTWFDYPNGARLWIGGMDDPAKILSGERDFIYVNQAEELTKEDWETLSTRATGRGAVTATPMLFGDCNPGPADHWLIQRRDAKSLTMLNSRHEDNPSLFDEHGTITEQGKRTISILDALTGVRYLRLRKGLWVGAEGQFFEHWDENLHTIAPFPIPADWPIWGSFDYGFTHNTAMYVFTRHDGTIYVIGEHVANKLLPSQHATAFDALLERLHIHKARLGPLHAGHDVFVSKTNAQGQVVAPSIAQQYQALGYPMQPAQIDRINGAAQLLLRIGNPTTTPPTKPTLKVFTSCPRLIATIPAMVHDPTRPEDVLKVDADADGRGGDDPYDAGRYGVMAQAQVFAPAVGGERVSVANYQPR